MQLSGLGRVRKVMSFTRWGRTEGVAQRCLVSWVWGILPLRCSLRAPRSSLVTSVLVCPASFSGLVFLPESHMSAHLLIFTLDAPSVANRNVCSAETWATDQTSPLPGSGSQPSHNYAVVTMYFSASKQGVFLMESPTSETLGLEDRTPVVGACSCCLLLYIFFVEEIRQSRNLWEGNILDFFFFFFLQGRCLARCNLWSTSKKLVWGRISSFH